MANGNRDDRMSTTGAREVFVADGFLAFRPHQNQRAEGEHVRDGVRGDVEEHRAHGERTYFMDCREADEDVARMRDRRIGQHALDARLSERGKVAVDHRRNREQDDDGRPARIEAHAHRVAERADQDAKQDSHRSRFHRHRHERGNRRGGALVRIGDPHVERHRADFERQADDQHDQSQYGEYRVGVPCGDDFPDAGEIGVGGRPVEQGASKEQNRSCKGAQEKILHRALDRAGTGPAVGDQGVGAQGHRLEPEENAQQINGAGEHHGAKRREDDEHVELASLEAVLAKIAPCKQRREAGADANDDIEEQAESIDGEVTRDELWSRGNVSADEHGAREGGSCEERGCRDQSELGSLRAEGIDEHDRQPGADEQQQRRYSHEGTHRAASSSIGAAIARPRAASSLSFSSSRSIRCGSVVLRPS